jgi:hypothetical protein
MSVRSLCMFTIAAIAIVALSRGAAQAGDKYQATIVADDTNSTAFTIAKPGSKIIIKPSNKPADGGIVVQLVLKNVDCASIGNDKGKPNKCGSKGANEEALTRKHVLNIGARALGVEVPNAAGVTYRLEKGTALFETTGKNKVSATQVFGDLASAILHHALGIGVVKVQERGTDPDNADTGCSVAPLPDPNTCIDGGVYGVAGITVP